MEAETTTVEPEKEKITLTFSEQLEVIRDAVKNGDLGSHQAARIRSEMGYENRSFTKENFKKVKRKRNNKMKRASRKANR